MGGNVISLDEHRRKKLTCQCRPTPTFPIERRDINRMAVRIAELTHELDRARTDARRMMAVVFALVLALLLVAFVPT